MVHSSKKTVVHPERRSRKLTVFFRNKNKGHHINCWWTLHRPVPFNSKKRDFQLQRKSCPRALDPTSQNCFKEHVHIILLFKGSKPLGGRRRRRRTTKKKKNCSHFVYKRVFQTLKFPKRLIIFPQGQSVSGAAGSEIQVVLGTQWPMQFLGGCHSSAVQV